MSKSRFKRKGKAKFLMIEGYVIRSAAWAALSPNDKAAYLELKWRYDGLNNGRIGLGVRDLAEAMKMSKNTAHRSLERLMEVGFLARAKPSGFNVKNRISTEWRLTEYRCDVSGHLATKDFMRWQPDSLTHETVAPDFGTRENKTQSHPRDTQSHPRDCDPSDNTKTPTHSPTHGTVAPNFGTPQSHPRDTYRYTRGGAATDGTPVPVPVPRRAKPWEAEGISRRTWYRRRREPAP